MFGSSPRARRALLDGVDRGSATPTVDVSLAPATRPVNKRQGTGCGQDARRSAG